jgi:hypothetical protein
MVTLALRRDRCATAKEDAAAFKEHIVSSAVPGQGKRNRQHLTECDDDRERQP